MTIRSSPSGSLAAQRGLDDGGNLGAVMKPLRWILVEASLRQPKNRCWCIARQLRPLRIAVENGLHDLRCRVARECTAAHQHLDEHAPERPDVRLSFGRF